MQPEPLIVATHLWAPNDQSFAFSTMYDESWVEKLYRGIKRNLTRPFEFICWVDREREFSERGIWQKIIETRPISYRACLEPFAMDRPTIIMGLDTVITGNIDHLADHAMRGGQLAVPRDPFHPHTVCNGVCLVPKGFKHIWDAADESCNDMVHIRKQDGLAVIDDLWPGHVVSYKGHARDNGLGDARIVYFHGADKPHEISDPWVSEHWR